MSSVFCIKLDTSADTFEHHFKAACLMLEQIFLHQKEYSLKLRTEPLKMRLSFLTDLERLILENQGEIVSALHADFAKPEAETLLTEIYPLVKEIQYAKKSLKKWMHPTPIQSGPTFLGTQNHIYREPRGVSLIISPWNYPLNLALSPLVGALAAGNCAFLKPSEISRHTSAFLKKYIPQYFATEHVTVIEGGKETTEELLQFPFDHIFFTGSTQVGKIIMERASRHLSALTLELGGKSPVIVDESANLKLASEKIIWGKFLNAGQTCVAPDYLLVQESLWPQLKPLLIESIEKFYGSREEQNKSPSLARIISKAHTKRLQTMIADAVSAGAEVVYGGEIDFNENFIGPTLIEKPDLRSSLMTEEIFGPLLPVILYKSLPEALQFVNARPKPLALYVFSEGRHNIDSILKETSSGGVAINDVVIQVGNHNLPFGGVGSSGLGNYHGYYGFRAFSHERAVLKRTWGGSFNRFLYPPYTTAKIKILKTILRWKL